jgi:2,3-bisphosphoglycerate-independent phosphoglycerate mutase
LIANFPNTQLKASGTFVGLPDSTRGNSEAGHLNIGAGKIVHQDVGIINDQIKSGLFFKNPNLNKAIDYAVANNSNLHLLGLVSDGGNHSHISHLFALLDLCAKKNFKRVYLDLITDGRDSDPESGVKFVRQVEAKLKEIGFGHISSISGRFYAMDRDNRWGRTSRAYNALVDGLGEKFRTAEAGLLTSYANRVTDEFIVPFLITDKAQLLTPIKESDAVIFFNFRADRATQLTESFVVDKFDGFLDRKFLANLFFVSLMPFEENLTVHSAFGPERVALPLALLLSQLGYKQIHIAETEKYAHVTYFFNGEVRQPFPGESRILVPSPKVLTYDLAPKMSAEQVSRTLIEQLDQDFDFYLVNFANPDMVGHTGNLAATIQAVEEVDRCLGDVIKKVKSLGGLLLITGDHGNAEKMIDIYSGEPNKEHSSNPVPFIVANFAVNRSVIKLKEGKLADIAITILNLLNIKKPTQMTGISLIK